MANPPNAESPSEAAADESNVRQPHARGAERLIMFSDAVVAIAATLLILPLVDTASNIGRRSVEQLLSDDWHALFAFGLSFVVIYRFWLLHHTIYEHVERYSVALAWTNGLWLLSIIFLPFPTELLGAELGTPVIGVGLYIGTMVVATAANLGTQWILRRSPELLAPGTPHVAIAPTAYAFVAMGVAFVIAITVPRIGLLALLLLLLPAEHIGHAAHMRWLRRREAGA
jgi:uncharacterized membrane protein